MKIFLYLGSRRGYAVLQKLITLKAQIVGILCLIEDPHEDRYYPQVKSIAEAHGIDIYFTDQTKPADYAEVIQKCQPDIAFAIGWRYLINKAAYSLPAKGTLIIHDSLLPTYRGFAPMNWAIINGEKETGVTLFHIADGVDCGAIIDQMKTTIDIKDTAKSVDDKILNLYEQIVEKNLQALSTGKIQATPQDESKATYTCKRTPQDGEIQWHQSSLQIYNLIRGLSQPFPGAYTTLRGRKIFIWAAELPQHSDQYVGNIPGRFVGKVAGSIQVLTGQGVLLISRLQFEGEVEQSAADFFMSVKDTFGR